MTFLVLLAVVVVRAIPARVRIWQIELAPSALCWQVLLHMPASGLVGLKQARELLSAIAPSCTFSRTE